MRKPIIAGNWKMHKTVSEAVSLVESLKGTLSDVDNVEVVFCPPFTALAAVAEAIKGTNFKLGAQNMYHKLQGAFTGEVSPLMLKDLNCDYVILGHSERREYFGETDEAINLKAKAAFENGLTPIVCVGEKLEEREAGITEKLVTSQTEKALAGLTDEQIVKLVVAYEPVWAIGTGKTATSEDANSVCALIRTTIAKMYSQELADQVRIQYGGSVKPDNATELMGMSDIDGALVGGASLDAPSFTAIVKY